MATFRCGPSTGGQGVRSVSPTTSDPSANSSASSSSSTWFDSKISHFSIGNQDSWWQQIRIPEEEIRILENRKSGFVPLKTDLLHLKDSVKPA